MITPAQPLRTAAARGAVDHQHAALARALHGFLDARVVLEAAHGAHRPGEGAAPAEGLEHRLTDLHGVAVLVAEVGSSLRRGHGMVPCAKTVQS
jgi:hypothetical protein